MSLNNETFSSNITQPPSSTVIDILNTISLKFVSQLPLIITILGFIGFIGNAFTFLQPTLRHNSYCIYTLCGSLMDIINLFINLLPNYPKSVDYRLTSNRFLCKLQLFVLVFLPQLSIDLLIMSLIDRYACTFNLTSPMRRLLKLKNVPWLILITIIISCIISLYSPILHDVIPEYGCVSIYPMLNGVIYILIHGILTPLIIFIIVMLTYRKFKQNRQRVGATGTMNINRFRNQFITTVFVQAFVTSFFALQWIDTYWYFIATQYENRTAEQWTIISFVIALTNCLYYLIFTKSFYLSTLTSRSFREAFITGLHKLLPRCIHRR